MASLSCSMLKRYFLYLLSQILLDPFAIKTCCLMRGDDRNVGISSNISGINDELSIKGKLIYSTWVTNSGAIFLSSQNLHTLLCREIQGGIIMMYFMNGKFVVDFNEIGEVIVEFFDSASTAFDAALPYVVAGIVGLGIGVIWEEIDKIVKEKKSKKIAKVL